MELKKNPHCDIHRKRGMFFTVGMICSLSLVIMAFQWTSTYIVDTPPEKRDILYDALAEVPSTNFVTERPEPQPIRTSNPTFVAGTPDPEIENIIVDVEEPTIIEPVVVNVVDVPVEKPNNGPYIIVEQMPEPIGGESAFYATLKNNLKYPPVARQQHVQGKVFIEFVILETGELSNFRIVKGIGAGCDEEAIRVLKLTKWKAGKQRGVPVKVRKTLPVHFVLN